MQLAARPSLRISYNFYNYGAGDDHEQLKSFPVIGHWVQDNVTTQS